MATQDILAVSPYVKPIADALGVSGTVAILIVSIVSIWALVWKGLALWKASKKNHLIWFIILLIVNTIGILEILYIYVFSRMDLDKKPRQETHHEKAEKPAVSNRRKR